MLRAQLLVSQDALIRSEALSREKCKSGANFYRQNVHLAASTELFTVHMRITKQGHIKYPTLFSSALKLISN